MHISLVITTYNRPDALKIVLSALSVQRTSVDFEVIIADDGSTKETATLIEQTRVTVPYSLHHVWQEDKGFRAAMARNRAIAMACGDYVIFLDGDCVPLSDFVASHYQLAELGWFVVGNRILLSQRLTHQVIDHAWPVWTWSFSQWGRFYLRGDVNRLFPLVKLPKLFRTYRSHTWQGAKTCNLGVWREDLLSVNGFDEGFEGWGHEDAELVVRLLKSGIRRKEGRFAVPVCHLWHPQQDRLWERKNWQRLEYSLSAREIFAQQGVQQYLNVSKQEGGHPC